MSAGRPASLADLACLGPGQTRSISAENPDGARAGGAQAAPGDDSSCTPAARRLGRGWKVRPCLRNVPAGATVTLADVVGPGTVQHVWMTVQPQRLAQLLLSVTYDDAPGPSIRVPLGAFFANGIDGLARVQSIPVAVNPRGGLNCYWPMPFGQRLRVAVTNRGADPIPELFYQITYALGAVPEEAGCLHASYRSSRTTREHPEHTILPGASGRGRYVGTYLIWHQFTDGWWGEGELKFFMDGDPPDAPTICGTGTEDYFGGAWGFTADDPEDPRPVNYSGPFLGYPQTHFWHARERDRPRATHGLYRWHVPDPVEFQRDLRVTVQALGWRTDGTYEPLADQISSVAFWYQDRPATAEAQLDDHASTVRGPS